MNRRISLIDDRSNELGRGIIILGLPRKSRAIIDHCLIRAVVCTGCSTRIGTKVNTTVAMSCIYF